MGGLTLSLWQDYALLFALPASAIGYAIGHRLGQPLSPGAGPAVVTVRSGIHDEEAR